MKRAIFLVMLALVIPAYSQAPKKPDAVIRAEREAEKCRKILRDIEAPYKRVKNHTPEEAAYHALMVDQQQEMIASAEAALALLLDEDPDEVGAGSDEGINQVIWRVK